MSDLLINFFLKLLIGVAELVSNPEYPFLYLFGVLIMYCVLGFFKNLSSWS